jgi:hypothetical protein
MTPNIGQREPVVRIVAGLVLLAACRPLDEAVMTPRVSLGQGPMGVPSAGC